MLQSLASALLLTLVLAAVCRAQDDDAYLWLEDVENEQALAWAKQRSDADTAVIEATPEFDEIHQRLLEIYNSSDRIPTPAIHGEWLYNFWQDADHVRGIWRRTTIAEFKKSEPAWETVLDLDALAEAEGENWVWKGVSWLEPEDRLCMVAISRGGADATVVREFDTKTKAFVTNGFQIPEAKNRVDWKDENTLWVGSDFGPGSLTSSGYPRLAKEWKRGTSLEQARTIFSGSASDVSVSLFSDRHDGKRYDVVNQGLSFFTGRSYLLLGDRLVKLDIPEDADLEGFFKDQMLVTLRTDWSIGDSSYPQGALLAIDLNAFLQGSRDFEILFQPEERVSLGRGIGRTKDYVIYTTLDNVRGRLYRLGFNEGAWSREEIELPGLGAVSVQSTSEETNEFFYTYTDFVVPTSLYFVDGDGKQEMVKSEPTWFDSTGMKVAQHEATSKDGTKIPYFVFMPKGFEANGSNSTLLTGYGGFEIARVPSYSGTVGTAWVAKGGVYVLANIRGGGEFGPKWHQAAVQEKHQTNFDDFIAVAEDLIARKITSPEHLGIMGGSQGGLLVGGCFTQRPDLFNAVVCAVPLLDMKRYNKLLAGASWMAEYGNPDTADWEYIKLWSPYHNLDENMEYPKVFFWTNTRDDRVHPGHARKMVAKMTEMGKPVLYYENTEGGHGGGANNNQAAYTSALSYAYLWMMLR